jgi:flagellin
MSFDINTNIASLQAQEYLRVNSDFQSKTINRVTSGLRIISSGDDAAGLAVANGYRSDQSVLTQGIRNANDGLSTLQTIDGGMNNISQLLDRARTLATQSASQTFTGDRSVLNGEFQNVLAEINRQAQSIGMTAGGDFAKTISVFIGGGRADSSTITATTNGSVTVDLSTSKLDTNSLGLSANGVAGNDVRSSTSTLSTALTHAAPVFLFSGSGFSGVSVTVQNWDAAHYPDQNALVAGINSAITSAAANNSSFAAANVRASVDSSTGKLTFTSTGAFSVLQNSAGASDLLGATPLQAATSSITTAFTTVTVADVLTFTYRDSSGVMQTAQATLSTANGGTIGAEVAIVNGTANLGGIFAVDDGGGNIVFMKADGGAFQVSSAPGGTTGIAAGAHGSTSTPLGNASSLDITSSSTSTNAVTSIAAAVKTLGQIQGTVGRAENQLGYAINLAQSQNTNLAAAESRIRDADLASEAANLTTAQILLQAGTAAVAQANTSSQVVLALLKG